MASTRLTDFVSGLPGMVFDYAGATAPNGFLLCYGQAISRTAYAALFAAIGTAHGVGDGSTTFNVPDLRGRSIAGQDNMGGTAAARITNAVAGFDGTALGAAGGVQSVALTVAQLPVHAHDTNASGSSGNINFGLGAAAATRNLQTGTGGGPEAGQLTSQIGSGTAHQNMQPTIVLNKIIKT